MSVQIIPEQTIVHCDLCGKRKGLGDFRKDAKLTLKQDALDFQGFAVANGTCAWDLCDSCAGQVGMAIDVLKAKIRAEKLTL